MTDEPLQELEVPEGVLDAEHAVEVLRAWIADGALHVIFEPGTFGHDVSEWGRLLSEISQHIASAAALEGQLSENEALTAIHEAYERGVLSPTGDPHGSDQAQGPALNRRAARPARFALDRARFEWKRPELL